MMVDLVGGRVVNRRMGRPKGPDKINSDIRNMILVALNNAGGDKYLERQAHANPVAFMGLLGKILPHQMKLEADLKGDAPISINLSWLTPERFAAPWRDQGITQAVGELLEAPVPPEVVDVKIKVKDNSDLW
jgi:hypothetical protein